MTLRVRSLHAVISFAMAFGYSVASAKGETCMQQVGKEQSEQLVRWCIDSSPATHPPCNSQNACALIVSEIQRGCALLKESEVPPFYCLLTYPANP